MVDDRGYGTCAYPGMYMYRMYSFDWPHDNLMLTVPVLLSTIVPLPGILDHVVQALYQYAWSLLRKLRS